jgi:hypothetical protein
MIYSSTSVRINRARKMDGESTRSQLDRARQRLQERGDLEHVSGERPGVRPAPDVVWTVSDDGQVTAYADANAFVQPRPIVLEPTDDPPSPSWDPRQPMSPGAAMALTRVRDTRAHTNERVGRSELEAGRDVLRPLLASLEAEREALPTQLEGARAAAAEAERASAVAQSRLWRMIEQDVGAERVLGGPFAAMPAYGTPLLPILSDDMRFRDGRFVRDTVERLDAEDAKAAASAATSAVTRLDVRRSQLEREIGPISQQLAQLDSWLLEWATPAERANAAAAVAQREALEQARVAAELQRIDAARTRNAIADRRREIAELERKLAASEAAG